MKIVGYVLLGIGCFLFALDYFAFNSGPSNVVNGMVIVGLCLCVVSVVLVSIATIREQSAQRAAARALQDTLPLWADAKTWEPRTPRDP